MALGDNIPPEFHKEFAAWVRIEPRCRSNDWAKGLQACTADPLWMLARQWQTGEFQGEDAGSPIEVRLAHSTQSLDRVQLGEGGAPIDLLSIPLEAVVEQERFDLDWRARVQIGQQFERFARSELDNDAQTLIDAYRIDYSLDVPTGPEWVNTDRATRRFIEFMTERVIDGKKLLEAIEDGPLVPPTGITANQLEQVLARFDEWRASLHLQPSTSKSEAWRNQQLDYRFELNPPTDPQFPDPQSDKTHLIAPDYRNGALDWYTFRMASNVRGPWIQKDLIKTHPTRISVAGTSPRWWAFEDAATDFGKLDVAKPDLAKLLLMEFVLIYGDDWFSVPVPVHTTELLNSGSAQEELKVYPKLVRIDGLKVYNVFGEDVDVGSARKPASDPLLRWEMFTLAPAAAPEAPAVADILFIPPVAGFRQESPPIEEVRFLRDEGANMVWGVEHNVPNGLGRTIDGFDAQRERIERRREADIARLEDELVQLEQELEADDLTDEEREAKQAEAERKREELATLLEGSRPAGGGGAPRYRLATTVPENWIPFITTNAQVFFGLNNKSIRLRRAQMLRNTDDEEPLPIPAMSRILDLSADPLLWLEEATVSRSGLRVQLAAQRVRWVDGKTYVWLGRKVTTGRGEGSSGLRFDSINR